MKFLIAALFIFLSSACFPQVKKDSLAIKYSNTIKAADLSEYLHVLASDSLMGRETGEPGQKKAAHYLAGKFKEFGVEPGFKKESGSNFFQQFELIKKEWQEVYIKVGKEQKVFLQDFYVYGDIKFQEEEKVEVVFVGHGIDSKYYSDYYDWKNVTKKDLKTPPQPLDVKDKVVIIFPGEPVHNGISLVTGDSLLSSWANDWKKKAATAKAKGARSVFIIVGKAKEDFTKRLDMLKEHVAKPSLSFTYKEKPGSAFFISIDMAAEMLGTTPEELMQHNNHNSLFLQGGILPKDTTVKVPLKNPYKLSPATLSIKCAVKESKLSTENVLGFIEGTDKKEEIIVLTAHYDHLGLEGGKICYGADDDGSGTVALLEIAQAFAEAKKNGHGPKRSILIMPVTAEEKGLMGSEFYADNPVYPLQNTVVNLNIDMIGRLDEAHEDNTNYIYLIGTNRLSTELHEVNENVNKTYVNIELDYTFNSFNDPNRFYYRSDHYNFAKNNIPVIFYFNGVHEDYHRPTDTVDKIIFPKVEKITRLIFFTAWELANMEKRIEVNVISE
ncbi:MAG: M28 family peptidase [Cytophagaceae bacterium]|nr:M28 family peptidase [Cytophagaceae bacterium]